MFESQESPESKGAQTGRDLRAAIVDELEYTYGIWLVVVGFAFFLTLDPATEVLISLLSEVQDNTFWIFLNRDPLNWKHQASILGLALLPIAAHACGQTAMRLCGKKDASVPSLGVLLFVICFAGYAVGFYLAIWSPEAGDLKINKLQSIVYLSVQLAIFPIFYGLHIAGIWQRFTSPIVCIALPFFAGLLAVAVGFAGVFSVSTATLFNPVAIVSGFAITACVVFSALTIISHNLPIRLPLILVLLALGIASQFFGAAVVLTAVFAFVAYYLCKGNRRWTKAGVAIYGTAALFCGVYAVGHYTLTDCRHLSGCNILRGSSPAYAGFEKIGNTVDHIAPDEEQPLRIVAAQGGGLYAAYHTAHYLAARSDLDAEFNASLYAISGVSGGAVGAGVYWAIATSGLCPTSGDGGTCHRDAVDMILNRDYLSPSLAAFLFRDHLDTYLPVSALFEALGAGPIDRGHVLEQQIEAAVAEWRESMGASGETGLEKAIGDTAFVGQSEADTIQKFPYLFLNGTQVDNGIRALISPVQRLRHSWANLRLRDGKHLSVLNGMVISARFPLVTPPARVQMDAFQTYETVQLVDGGYFDNSGVETALDIILELNEAGVKRPIHLLIFEADKELYAPQIKGLLGAPISAFTGAWRARRDHSIVRIPDVLDSRDQPISFEICNVTADISKLNFTVSWFLSDATFQDLAVQTSTSASIDRGSNKKC